MGAGLTGSLLTIELLRTAQRRLCIDLVDPRPLTGGVAYGAAAPWHLLNVRASSMSAVDDDPQHFVRWLTENNEDAGGGQAFVSRVTYGRYLRELTDTAIAGATQHEVNLNVDTAKSIGDSGTLTLASDKNLPFDALVLCLGNSLAPLPRAARGLNGSARVISEPFNREGLKRIDANDRIAILGTGLTMVDTVLSLSRQGHRGPIQAFSRHGYLPARHSDAPLPPLDAPTFTSLRDCVAWVRAERSADWRQTIDALRPHSHALWQALSSRDRQRFLRHVRAHWVAHRHRIAASVHDELTALLKSGQLTTRAGRLVDAREEKGIVLTLAARGTQQRQTLHADWLINCGGYAFEPDALVRDLVEKKRARLDSFGLGVDIATDCALLDASGSPSRHLYAAGPPTRGASWEITAAPEIRAQCRRLAQHLSSG